MIASNAERRWNKSMNEICPELDTIRKAHMYLVVARDWMLNIF